MWKAAAVAGWSGHIRLEKNLPHGAGIGGGSADAAAALRYLERPDLAVSLGADIPVCLNASAQRMRGVGEVLTPLNPPELWAVLVNPHVTVRTPDVFSGLLKKQNDAMPDQLPSFKETSEVIAWLAEMRNDLEAPAITAQPIIRDVLTALEDLPEAKLCRMSGSGATCFALFESQAMAKHAASYLQATHPDWWIVDCALS